VTAPTVVRDKFLGALEQTVNSGGALLSGVFKLLFLFPAIACVFLTELLVQAEAVAFKAPQVIQLPIPFPKKAER
jgi:hypothetical protein